MVIDLEHDELIPVGELCKQRLGKRPSPATLWRWRLRGVRGVKLEAVCVGGCWCTTREAFATFIREQTDAAIARSSGGRTEDTEQKLQSAGLI